MPSKDKYLLSNIAFGDDNTLVVKDGRDAPEEDFRVNAETYERLQGLKAAFGGKGHLVEISFQGMMASSAALGGTVGTQEIMPKLEKANGGPLTFLHGDGGWDKIAHGAEIDKLAEVAAAAHIGRAGLGKRLVEMAAGKRNIHTKDGSASGL